VGKGGKGEDGGNGGIGVDPTTFRRKSTPQYGGNSFNDFPY